MVGFDINEFHNYVENDQYASVGVSRPVRISR